MDKILSSLSVQKKLFVPVVLLTFLLVVVAVFFYRNEVVVDNAKQELSANKKTTDAISSYFSSAESFIQSQENYEGVSEKYKLVTSSFSQSNLPEKASLLAEMASINNKLEQIHSIYQDNGKTATELVQKLRESSKVSDDYLYLQFEKLVDEDQRKDVTTFERKILTAALINTVDNFELELIFQKVQSDISYASRLLDYISGLEANNKEAIIQLEGSPAKAEAEKVRDSLVGIRALSEKYIENSKKVQALNAEISRSLGTVMSSFSQIEDENLQVTFEKMSASLLNILIILCVVVVVTIVLSVLFASSISKPLKDLEQHINDLAKAGGDLTFRIKLDRKDEIGKLAVGINAFIETLHDVFKGVATNSNHIAHSAKESSQLSKTTLKSMMHQNSETETVAASFGQMESSIHEISSNASSAAQVVQGAVDKAKLVVASIGSTISNVDSVSRNLEEATAVINKLNGDTQNIGKILDVIRDIAEQTNLLALNAAIEAARAGEQGRGFAVVADEVRSLAQRTQSSIDEIGSMISNLQGAANQASEVIVRSNESIGQTTDQSRQTGDNVDEIAHMISTISDMNLQVAAAVEEQSAVVQEINKSINEINQLAISCSDAARLSDQSADEQAKHSQALQGLIGRFKV
ncbi:methyl-accepting chemotaxis protein [Marinomonas sp. FW-1]|uniref:methyl-accepting chemotaxis protein n=1 Tax=Marinomonas sp. FW-1 TaxID=2071621 RepID=UPI0010BF73FE|nr:methyl-accepting chemotaxis protein [Marinomonas sp. FW-1]